VLCRQERIEPSDLPPTVASGQAIVPSGMTTGAIKSLQEALAEPERRIIRDTLIANKGSRQETAAQLGINRCTLYKKMKKYGLLGEV
jgi:DNA-binding NtrC family response regulator